MIKEALFLRAEIPPDVERVRFESLYTNDDSWSHLWCRVCDYILPDDGEAQIWHFNSPYYREVQYTDKVKERWIPDMKKEDVSSFDLVWARGGLPPYPEVIARTRPDAHRIYYGAGKRFFPIPPNDYNLVLVDSVEQKKAIHQRFPNQKVSLFIKPAAPLFVPMPEITKEYDVCVSFQLASYTKRFELAVESIIQGGFSALVVGYVPSEMVAQIRGKYPQIVFAGRVTRKVAVGLYNRCRVGLAVHSQLESCPRVIPEFLACNLPLVVTKDTLFWREKYITRSTGCLTNPNVEDISKSIKWALEYKHLMNPREYYKENLNNREAGYYLARVISDSWSG